MKLTWMGNASFKIVSNKNTVIYIDPYADEFGYEQKADIVLVSHGHNDHCARDKIKKIDSDHTVILTTRKNSGAINGQYMDIGDEKEILDIKIQAVPAYNIRKEFHPKGDVLGFRLLVDSKIIYFAADTDLIPEMKDIECDIALLPIGGTYTMNAREAAKAVEIIKPRIVIPMHYGDVAGTRDDAEVFVEELEHFEVKVIVMNEGETIDF